MHFFNALCSVDLMHVLGVVKTHAMYQSIGIEYPYSGVKKLSRS